MCTLTGSKRKPADGRWMRGLHPTCTPPTVPLGQQVLELTAGPHRGPLRSGFPGPGARPRARPARAALRLRPADAAGRGSRSPMQRSSPRPPSSAAHPPLGLRRGGPRPGLQGWRRQQQNDGDDERADATPPTRPPPEPAHAAPPGRSPARSRSRRSRGARPASSRPAPPGSNRPACAWKHLPAAQAWRTWRLSPCQVLRVAILLSYCSILCNYKAIEMPSHQTYGGSWKFLTFIDLVRPPPSSPVLPAPGTRVCLWVRRRPGGVPPASSRVLASSPVTASQRPAAPAAVPLRKHPVAW